MNVFLFVDFSSAFNTVQQHLFIKKLNDLNVHPSLLGGTTGFYRMVNSRSVLMVLSQSGELEAPEPPRVGSVHLSFLPFTQMSIEAIIPTTISLHVLMILPS